MATAGHRDPTPETIPGPRTREVGDSIELRVPCCAGTVLFPAELARTALAGGSPTVFAAACPCGYAHLATTEADGVHLRVTTEPAVLGQIFATMPWPALPTPASADESFLEAKTLPDLAALLDYLNSLGIRTVNRVPPARDT